MSSPATTHAVSQRTAGNPDGFGLRDIRVFNALLLAGVIAFFIGYLALNNQAATKGFAIRSMEEQITTLEDQRRKLDLEVVAAQSMGAIQSRLQGLGLVPIAGVEYVSGAAGAVAVK